jgi:hypothetical protein
MKPKKEKKPYEVTLLKDGRSLRSVLKATNRAKAVARAQVKFREKYGDSLGPAYRIMTVTDPYHEVIYSPGFNCADGVNRLLPDDVINRVIAESNGELIRETDEGKMVPLKRLKRKKQYGSRSVGKATGIRKNEKGNFLYRVVLTPIRVKGGVIVQKKEVKDYRLEAKSFIDAIAEVKNRNLGDKQSIVADPPKPVPPPVKVISVPIPEPKVVTPQRFKLTEAAARILEKTKVTKVNLLADSLQSYFGKTKAQLAEKLTELNRSKVRTKQK